MKLNETFSEAKMELIASAGELERGEVTLNHPRNGRCVIRKVNGKWTAVVVPNPDVP